MARIAAPLTATEIDAFSRKLKATLALAQQAIALKSSLARFAGASGAVPRISAVPPTPGAAPKAAKAVKAKAGGRKKRQPGIPPEKVAAVLKGAPKDGLSLGDLSKKLGESNKDRVGAALRKLRESKQAKVVGDRQFAKWFPA